jgi:hypothetical protein
MLLKEASKLFQKIIGAYDDSPAGRDALSAGIQLCKLHGTALQTITVIEPPPIYTGLIFAVAPDVAQGLESDRRRYHERLMEFAVAEGHRHSVARFWSTVLRLEAPCSFWQFMHSLVEVREKSTRHESFGPIFPADINVTPKPCKISSSSILS